LIGQQIHELLIIKDSDEKAPISNQKATTQSYSLGILYESAPPKLPMTLKYTYTSEGRVNGNIKKTYDSGSILDFEVSNHKVILGIEWTDYPPKPRKSDFSTIKIEAEKIEWENIPDLQEDCCNKDRKL